METRSPLDAVLPFARQARYLGRYRQIAEVFARQGFGYILEQLGLHTILSLPRRTLRGVPPPQPISGAERFREALVELGPTFIKLGQLLSTRPDLLPPAFILELTTLHSTVPPFSAETAREMVESELGQPVHVLFREFSTNPIAAASIGQVHTAVLLSGEHVVVKVQRPGIAQVIDTDLAILTDLAALAQENNLFGPQYDMVELAWEFSTSLRDELNYRREASNTDRVRLNFAHNDHMYVPMVYWNYTTSRILTMEQLHGIKIDNIPALQAQGIDCKMLAQHSVEILVEEVYIHGMFHADPHPGNIFALPGGVIGAIDFGQVGVLDRDTRKQLIMLMLALVNHDHEAVVQALVGMGVVSRQDVSVGLRRDALRFISRYVDQPLKELSMASIGNDLIEILHRHGLRLPSPIALLLKALITMEGTGKLLDPELDVFGVTAPYLQRAAAHLFSPIELGKDWAASVRKLSEIGYDLPIQIDALLYRLNRGEVLVRTREEELKHLAAAVTGAVNRLAIALVLSAFIISTGVVLVAVGLGEWTGTLPLTLSIIGGVSIGIMGVVLVVGLLRG